MKGIIVWPGRSLFQCDSEETFLRSHKTRLRAKRTSQCWVVPYVLTSWRRRVTGDRVGVTRLWCRSDRQHGISGVAHALCGALSGSLTARECAETGDGLTAAAAARWGQKQHKSLQQRQKKSLDLSLIAFDNESRRDNLKGRQIFICLFIFKSRWICLTPLFLKWFVSKWWRWQGQTIRSSFCPEGVSGSSSPLRPGLSRGALSTGAPAPLGSEEGATAPALGPLRSA